MGQFDDLTKLKGSGSPFDKLTPSRIVGVRETLPAGVNPPPAYVEFIENVGFGTLSGDTMAIYNGLVPPEEVFGSNSPDLANILLFGDDMCGNAFGFDLSNWTVVEVTAYGEVNAASPASFPEFMRSKIFPSGRS